MDILTALFTAWLSLTGSIAGAPVQLHSKAAYTDIEQVEQAIGHRLTDELRTIYMMANGQVIPDPQIEDPSSRPLFQTYWFHTLDEAVDLRQDLLASTDSGVFTADWFPFASNGEGSGWAVDLGAAKEGSIGMLVAFGDASVSANFSSTISAYLQRALAQLDPLHLHQTSDRKLLGNMRRWYFKHSKSLSRPAEIAYTEALRPWVLPTEKILYERPGNYKWLLAAHMDQMELCNGIAHFDVEEGSRAVKLAHDWLRNIRRIATVRYEKFEAIRLNLDGKRDSMLARTKVTKSNDNGRCEYMIDYKNLVR